MYHSVICLLCLCIGLSLQQTPRCLLSNEAFLPCQYRNRRLMRAESNEYSVHHTILRQGNSGFIECNVRAVDQDVREITDLGTEEMRIIFSPGFITGVEYDNQMRVEYLVQCAEDELAFYNVTTMNLQSIEDCQDENGVFVCQDYLQILSDDFGPITECGNSTSPQGVLQLRTGSYTIVFRSSEEVRATGFEMYNICFRSAENNLDGCVEVEEFTTGVCANETSMNELKRSAEDFKRATKGYDITDDGDMAMGYAELFTGYPAHLRMARDLANFHHQWNIRKRVPGDDEKVIKVNIRYDQVVFYQDSTILVFGPESNVIPAEKFEGVLVLQTFNAKGEIDYYLKEFNGTRTPHFSEAGPLIIIGRNAYYQLFVIDPRDLLPSPEEQVELIAMTTPLLERVPESEDVISIDPDQRPADLSQFPGLIDKRQTEENITLTEMDREAVLAALRNMNACNAVNRAQSRATLTYYRGINESFVESLSFFPISCSLNGNLLNCETESTTLPGRTSCRIDTRDPFMCEPFNSLVPIQLDSTPTTSVTVRAINCLGQRAEQVVPASSDD